MADLITIAAEFGARATDLHAFDADGPQLLPYATLVTARRNGHGILRTVAGVYEWQSAPLMFLIDRDSLIDDEHLRKVRRLLAMRGDAPYLGIVEPGRLEVYSIALDDKAPADVKVEWGDSDDEKAIAFARLGNQRPKASVSNRDWISNVVLKLLTGSISRLITSESIGDDDAISLVGRALFTRFLADRDLLPANVLGTDKGASLFDSRDVAKRTSSWLDRTFNGDLLPLTEGIYERLGTGAFAVLGDILRRAPDGQLFLGWQERWDHLDFAHIPVGVLSQAYELYLRRHANARQRKEGGYYTPRPIADLMVRASFKALQRTNKAHLARVLDPAAGAGVFLLTAFRELIAEKWRVEQTRPGTRALRDILYNQITGFDVNEAALRFAALGLYLLSIELDPEPKPVDKLKFDDLRGKVLHLIVGAEGSEGFELGSLGPLVGDEHLGRYDLVIGNPPWSSGTGLSDWQFVRKLVSKIAAERGVSVTSPPLPNEGLDLPFVWRAIQWAKPEGQITFALHARLLFQQGDGMTTARQALFEALDITSVINGVELRHTKVWPEVSAPFCVLIATNKKPGPGSSFRLISPRVEESMNEAGTMRVDALNAELIPTQQLIDTPEILKILFRGTKADLGLVERIRSKGFPTLREFWTQAIGLTDRGLLRGSGNGYQRLRDSSRTRKTGDGLPGVDARYLIGKPEITALSFSPVAIDTNSLGRFTHPRIHDPRSEAIFKGPLVVVHEAPPVHSSRIGVAVVEEDAVFNQSFYGYSTYGFGDPKGLARYFALVLGSQFTVWMTLVTSGRFGVEREAVEKATLDRIPIPDYRTLDSSLLSQMDTIYENLKKDASIWHDADEWVADVYGLSARDRKLISDTLEFNLPFSSNRHNAQIPPPAAEQINFCEIVEGALEPWGQRFGTTISVSLINQSENSPWYGLSIRVDDDRPAQDVPGMDWKRLLLAADDLAATEIILHVQEGGLLIGRLAQRRYWSESQALSLAQQIVWTNIEMLKGRPAA